MRKIVAASILIGIYACSVCLAAPAAKRKENKITLNVENVDVAVVLATLFKQAGTSYVLSADVKGKTTLRIQDKSLHDALAALLTPLGLTASQSDGVYVVEKAPAKPVKAKPSASAAILKQLPPVEKEVSIAKAAANSNSNTQTPYAFTPGPAPMYYPYQYQYPGYYSVQLSPGMYYSPTLQIPGVLVLPRPYYYPPFMTGQP